MPKIFSIPNVSNHFRSLAFSALFCLMLVGQMSAQETAFSYQGSLKDGVNLANGNYDFELALFDALTGGSPVGSTLTRSPVAVSNGIFSVSLDFGGVFPGASRFLEIHVRPTGGGSFNTLSPRQQIDSAPYSVKSLSTDTATTATNADQLGGVAASQYVVTTDPRMTDARSPTVGSGNYIQNQNAAPQATSNFSISGTGTASIFNAATQYNIGGSRVLAIGVGFNGTTNIFAGVGAGQNNTAGAGLVNSFFGANAGFTNTTGGGNSFFGAYSGFSNEDGQSNSFFGDSAGYSNTNGIFNTFIGQASGSSNTSGSYNTSIGYNAGANFPNLTNATAIGANANVSQSNSVVLGDNANVGIGTSAPAYKLHVVGADVRVEGNAAGTFPRYSLNFTGGSVDGKKWQNYASLNGLNFTALNDAELSETRWLRVNRGTGTAISSVQFESGFVVINNLGAAGATALCRNASSEISTCSSSLRYKTNIGQFSQGMSFVRQLRPITFDWKDGGMRDVGFGAEDIAKIDPRFVTYNDKGEVEGVKYDRLSVAFVNAFNEQQQQIEKQQTAISSQQSEIEALKQQIKEQKVELDAFRALICAQNPAAEVCGPKK